MNQYQQKYWSLLRELKTHVIYLHLYAAGSEKLDKYINIFLALTSSSSIAAWAIWQEHQIIWAGLIATSQVITAVKPFLPFNQRVKLLCELNDKVQEVSLECERDWYSVSEGELTEKEIHELYINLRDKVLQAEKEIFNGVILPKNQSYLKAAELEADAYLRSTFF